MLVGRQRNMFCAGSGRILGVMSKRQLDRRASRSFVWPMAIISDTSKNWRSLVAVGRAVMLSTVLTACSNLQSVYSSIRTQLPSKPTVVDSSEDANRPNSKGPIPSASISPPLAGFKAKENRQAIVAKNYVAKIVAGGADTKNHLIDALIAASYPVFDEKAKLISINGIDGHGVPVRHWELIALQDIAKSNWIMPLTSLEKILKTIPDFEGIPWGKVLLEGIRGAATDKDESARFWASLVAEFGKAQVGQDLLDPVLAPERVILSSMQYQLILRRLASEFLLSSDQRNAISTPRIPVRKFIVASSEVTPGLLAQNTALSVPSECQFTNDEGVVQANAEWAMGKYWDWLYKYIAKAQKIGAKKLGKAVKAAGIFLDAAEAGILAGSMRVEFRLEGEPLVRTKTTKPGESKPLWLKVWHETGREQYVNCAKIVTTSGILTHELKISIPTNGPLKKAAVRWSGGWGFRPNQWVFLPESNFPDLLMGGGVEPGSVGPGEVGPESTRRIDFPTSDFMMNGPATETDSQGRTYVVISGRAQKHELPKEATKVSREAIVWVQVAPGGADLSDVDAIKDAVKKRTPTGALTALVKTGLMTNWLHKFKVTDWATEYILEVHGRGKLKAAAWSPMSVEKIGTIRLKPKVSSDGTIAYEGNGALKFDLTPTERCNQIEESHGNQLVRVTGDIRDLDRASLTVIISGADLHGTLQNCFCPTNRCSPPLTKDGVGIMWLLLVHGMESSGSNGSAGGLIKLTQWEKLSDDAVKVEREFQSCQGQPASTLCNYTVKYVLKVAPN